MHAEIRKAVQQPELRSRMHEQGVEMIASQSPERFSACLRAQHDNCAQVVKSANIRAD
jgi:tripartite-type tricarboxylate transporter receptor subunit TctC